MKLANDHHKKEAQASERGKTALRVGIWAERATLWLMWLRGWDLVAWRQKMGRYELDLILSRGNDLRLIEVKARKPGAWVNADIALTEHQRVRLQSAMRQWLDKIPWPKCVSFQRVSWSGMRCKFHPPENWDSLKIQR
ncbi:MAG: YraN family protein [Holophagaceae bacterium]|nr:YraN family protein [Holophagaceae bacterium]